MFLYIFHASNYIQFTGDLIEIYKFRVHYITLLHGFEMEMVYIVGMSPCHAHMFNDTVDMIRIVINTFFFFNTIPRYLVYFISYILTYRAYSRYKKDLSFLLYKAFLIPYGISSKIPHYAVENNEQRSARSAHTTLYFTLQ